MRKSGVCFAMIAIILLLLQQLTAAQTVVPDLNKIHNDHGTVMFLIHVDTGSITYVNQAAVDFYGYSKEQLLTMKITDINTLTPRETAEEMQAAIAEERNYFVFRHRLANGRVRTVEVYSYPQLINGQEYLFSIIHDITAKTMLETRIRTYVIILAAIALVLLLLVVLFLKNQKKMRRMYKELNNYIDLRQTFIDADDSVIYLKDNHLRYVFINKAFEEMHDRKASEVIGFRDDVLVDDKYTQIRNKSDLSVINEDRTLVYEVHRNKRILRATKFPVRLLNGQRGVGAYIKDVTDEYTARKNADIALKRNMILVDVLTRQFDSAQQQLDYVLCEAVELTESKYGYIYLYNEESQEFTLNSWSGEVMAECRVANPPAMYHLNKTGLWGEAVRQRKPIIIVDFDEHNLYKKGFPEGHVKLTTFMIVPVFIEGKIVAVIGLANKDSDYDEMDIKEITALMQGVWNARERREAQISLTREREKYLLTLLSIGDAVMVVNRSGQIEMLNSVAEKLTGWTSSEAVGKHYKEIFYLTHEIAGERIKDPIETVFASGKVEEMDNHAVLISRDNSEYHLEDSAAPMIDETGQITGVVLVFRDVTEKKLHRQKIEYLSFHDSLTGLYNRRFFEEELQRLDTPRNLPISVIMGDVNGLKLTNDVFGHSFGDILLQKVAATMRKVCRADDIIARWGGDEFVILLPKTSGQEAQQIACRLQDSLAQEQVRAIRSSMAVGTGVKHAADENIMFVLETAEHEMYRAKTLSRSTTNADMLQGLLNAFFEQFPGEQAHAGRVSEISVLIGMALHLPEEEIKILKDAAYMHDIGKIALDEALLKKEGQPSEYEWKEMKQHPVIGYRILHAFEETLQLAEHVLYHHERWDGNGYPQNRRGEEIPRLARIITLAESYDAMIHPLYKEPLSKDEAVAEMKRNAGQQFDPELVHILTDTFSQDAR